MELLHPAMWHDRDIDFAMWHVALESWQWIYQVAAPCNVIRGSGMTYAVEFARWQHPAMSHIALGSWHWIRQVAAPCNVAGGSGMTCHGIRPNVRRIIHLCSPYMVAQYWNSTSGFDFDHITAVDMSFCTSLRNFIKIGPPSAEKMTSCRFSRWRISAILHFRGPIMGSLKSPCRLFVGRQDTIALNCLVFEKIAYLQFGDRQTDRQTNRWTRPSHEAALAVASGGLITAVARIGY